MFAHNGQYATPSREQGFELRCFPWASLWPHAETLALRQLMFVFQCVVMLPSFDVMRICIVEGDAVTLIRRRRKSSCNG